MSANELTPQPAHRTGNSHVGSINLGKAAPVSGAKNPYLSGIAKQPVTAPVRVTKEGLEGDAVCDRNYHGGPDQAVYLYSAGDYAWWEAELKRPITPGTFGENLTLAGWDGVGAAVGDRFTIGDVVLEATSPRVPCATLSQHMGDPKFLKMFRLAERPGIYCRVLREGVIQVGDAVQFEPKSGERLEMLELYRDAFAPAKDEVTLRRHLAAPLAIRLRETKETLLAEIQLVGG